MRRSPPVASGGARGSINCWSGRGQWRSATPAGVSAGDGAAVAYFGHEVVRPAGGWSGPARIVAVGAAGAPGSRSRACPCLTPGCTLMTLERAERELRQARDFLGWMARRRRRWSARWPNARPHRRHPRATGRADLRGCSIPTRPFPSHVTPWRISPSSAACTRVATASRRSAILVSGHASSTAGRIRAPVEARKAAQEALWAQRPGDAGRRRPPRVFGPHAAFGASSPTVWRSSGATGPSRSRCGPATA